MTEPAYVQTNILSYLVIDGDGVFGIEEDDEWQGEDQGQDGDYSVVSSEHPRTSPKASSSHPSSQRSSSRQPSYIDKS